MKRSQVTQDRSAACAAGLHVGNLTYINDYWSRNSDVLLAVEVDPRNLVSVPSDAGGGKIRVCEYKVLCKVNFETTLRKHKFLTTDEFIENFCIKEIQPVSNLQPKLTEKSTESDWESWVDNKLQKLTQITWGGLLKSFKKTYGASTQAFKKFIEDNYSIQKEKKSENSKIRKK